MAARTKRPPKTKAPSPAPPAAPPSRLPVVLLWTVVPVAIALLMLWYALLARAQAGELGFPLDDSWIHVRFAQNLAAGKGMSFNPGVPTSTTTSVLWTLLFAGAYRITHESLLTSAVINWALCVALCALVYQLALLIHPNRWFAFGAALTMAVTPPLPWWALSGMEPPLYATLALLAIWLHIKGRMAAGPRTMLPAAVMALAALARPELLLLFPLALLDGLLMGLWLEKEPAALRRWLARLAWQAPVFLLILAPQFLYNHQVTGYWLPSSFYSKVPYSYVLALEAGNWGPIFAGCFRELWSAVRVWTKNNPLLILPFFLGLGLLLCEARRSGRAPRSLLVPLVLVLQPVAWALAGGFRPVETQGQRYVANLDALYVPVALYGGWRLGGWFSEFRTTWGRVAGLLGVLVLSLFCQRGFAVRFATNVKNINEMQVTLGRWLQENTPKEAVLAVNDIGAIGVFADRTLLDIQGLISPEALAPRDATQRQVYVEHQVPSIMADFIFSRHPDYVVIFPQWYPEMDARRDLLTPVYEVTLADNITCGAPTMVVYRTIWAKPAAR